MSSKLYAMSALAGVAACAGVSTAQVCQPHWASIPCGGMPGWPLIFAPVAHVVDGHPRLFLTAGLPDVTAASGPQVWLGQEWRPLPTTGLPPSNLYGSAKVFDDGTGERLFFQTYATNTQVFSYEGSTWTPYPPEFTTLGRQKFWSLDLGAGTRVFGQLGSGRQVGMWDGAHWNVLGTMTTPNERFARLEALARPEGGADLYVIGSFTSIDGVEARGLARWDGMQWHEVWNQPMLQGDGQPVMTAYDNGSGPALYTNSTPQTLPQTQGVQGLYRWDGTTLSLVGATENGMSFPVIMTLAVFDDGRGPALYIGGGFTSIGGVPARNLARWDGHSFEQVGGGVQTIVKDLGVFHDKRGLGLWVKSDVNPTVVYAGGGVANGLAAWFGCKEAKCYVNCDLSTKAPTLNVNDFMCFLNMYAQRDPYADCTTDGVQNVADFLCFMNRFAAGCS